jgi:hypothetical protein
MAGVFFNISSALSERSIVCRSRGHFEENMLFRLSEGILYMLRCIPDLVEI